MDTYGQYCPVARAAEILGDRWTLLIVRDLVHDVRTFNELSRGLPGLSRGLLSQRLRALQASGILEPHEARAGARSEYRLTPAGLALRGVMESLLHWGARWAFEEPAPQELDPVLLMWWMRRRVCHERLPAGRTVVQFDFDEDAERSFWLLLLPDDVSVCFHPPGFDTDVWVRTDLATLYEVWLGRARYEDAVSRGELRVRSLPALEQAFPTWFLWSDAAPAVRAALDV
ncbi:winged helix-turn-helix transcriptional regulator [Deinococcus pimensis]|uniref:winged helix-turn-helix transcriptional regulator n=1 Tax=Deinococcus pimensis TaxID=309888 RepID=UPI0004B6D81C|nr:helix-turn-helix domain-containing protein [Deinococcus pimensis]